MNIQDLKIGDKVTHLGRIVTIRSIYDTGHVEFLMKDRDHVIEFTVNSKEVEPISLTDNMLDNMGECVFVRAKGRYWIFLSDEKNIPFAYLIKDYRGYEFSFKDTRKRIVYLHQLQHELLDASIEFKLLVLEKMR